MCIRIVVINPTSIHQDIFELLFLELSKDYFLTILDAEEKRLAANVSLVTVSDLLIASPYFESADILLNPFTDRTIDKYITSKTKVVTPKNLSRLSEVKKMLYLLPEVLLGFAIGRYTKLTPILSLPNLDLPIAQTEILKAFEMGYNFAKTQNFGFDIFPKSSLNITLEDFFLTGEEKSIVCLDCLNIFRTKTPSLEPPEKPPAPLEKKDESSVEVESQEDSISVPIKIEID